MSSRHKYREKMSKGQILHQISISSWLAFSLKKFDDPYFWYSQIFSKFDKLLSTYENILEFNKLHFHVRRKIKKSEKTDGLMSFSFVLKSKTNFTHNFFINFI